MEKQETKVKDVNVINWESERAIRNYCGYCNGSPSSSGCSGSCFDPEYTDDYLKNRKDHIKRKLTHHNMGAEKYRRGLKFINDHVTSNLKGLNRICINIWDDFYEDGYVPEGNIQETYAYVEMSDVSHDHCKQFLDAIHDYMKDFLRIQDDGVDIEMEFQEGAKKYPGLVGTENEIMLFDRWELKFKHLTHSRLHKLVNELGEANFEFEGIPFDIYSES